ncbi:type 1 phosphatases regulator ypi2 [Phtheirospermum japonicum]|uniref:Type 1 phosphatases regulator ypi2 n=1 Tax=Phtheirospermum japonicum TaxID=374723 RepID=A0A830B966_9LAMI|nr:type 1 phosphatases regulator ypi2 [Phtheirospermum japonicum]
MARSSPSTTTVILEPPPPSSSHQPPQITDSLVLKLKRPKKKVSWMEGTVNNEFMNKKSSKKCCIFHKEKPFDEDDSDHDHGDGMKSDDESNGHSHEGDGNCRRHYV